MPMGSVKSKFANKSPNPPSDLIDSPYPRPSNEENKSRCITDSHNNAVVATEFVTSSHMSIQDKVAEKSFAMKVLHENNQRINSIINNKSNYLQSEIKEKRVSPMDKSQDIRNLLESSNMSVNDEIN
jgi:dynactin complex subunit